MIAKSDKPQREIDDLRTMQHYHAAFASSAAVDSCLSRRTARMDCVVKTEQNL